MTMIIDGVILAGGQSLRMGRDKASLMVAGKTLLQHQIEQMQPQVKQIFIAGNAITADISQQNVLMIADVFKQYEGPLSGALSALNTTNADFLWIMPCDSFGFGDDLKCRLLDALTESGADIAYLEQDGNAHPLMAVWRTTVKNTLFQYLQSGERSVLKWYKTMPFVGVACTVGKGQCCNMNTPEDFQALLDTLC